MDHNQYLSKSYFPALDGVRAISAIAVITAHMHAAGWAWLSGGRGLTWFFILSGYLITRMCLREEAEKGHVSMVAFFVRRCFRIFPLYYATLAVYCAVIVGIGVSPEKREPLIKALPYYATYLSEIPAVFGLNGVVRNIPFAHSWSLGIEEKFYLVWPAITFWIIRRSSDGRVALTVVATLILLLGQFLTDGRPGVILHAYASILSGCILAFALNNAEGFNSLSTLRKPVWSLAVLLSIVLLHFATREASNPDAISSSVVLIRISYTILATVTMACILVGDGLLQRILQTAPMRFVGKISYGIYLLHRLCLNFAEKLIDSSFGHMEGLLEFSLTCVLAIGCAYAAHVFIESPCIAFGRKLATRLQATLALPQPREMALEEVGAGKL